MATEVGVCEGLTVCDSMEAGCVSFAPADERVVATEAEREFGSVKSLTVVPVTCESVEGCDDDGNKRVVTTGAVVFEDATDWSAAIWSTILENGLDCWAFGDAPELCDGAFAFCCAAAGVAEIVAEVVAAILSVGLEAGVWVLVDSIGTTFANRKFGPKTEDNESELAAAAVNCGAKGFGVAFEVAVSIEELAVSTGREPSELEPPVVGSVKVCPPVLATVLIAVSTAD